LKCRVFSLQAASTGQDDRLKSIDSPPRASPNTSRTRGNSGLETKSLLRGDQSWVTVLPRSDGTAEPDFLCTRGAGVCERLLAILVQHPGADRRQGRKEKMRCRILVLAAADELRKAASIEIRRTPRASSNTLLKPERTRLQSKVFAPRR